MTTIAVFASGRGSNFINLYRAIQEGQLSATIGLVVSNNPGAPVVQTARSWNIPVRVLSPTRYTDPQQYEADLLHTLAEFHIEWIALAGYMKKIPASVIRQFPNRIVNIHPALLPAFGGKGMYGMHVHEAVFQSGAQVTGVTIHFVNEEYDQGAIIFQEPVVIRECRSPEEIAEKVLAVEHRVYPRVLQQLLTHPFEVVGKRVYFNQESETP